MDINEGSTTDDLWTPYKELVSVVEGYLAHESGDVPYSVHTFESVLRRHKQTFLTLMKNPPKNTASREEIKRGITEGITLPSVGRTVLSKELVDEAIIISDMYNVSEYLALELLHTAQRQLPRHPGLPRGLVAILLYYDGRRALVQALKELCMARDGVCWTINAREEIIAYVSRYVDQLISDGLLGNVVEALGRFTVEGELDLLQRNRAVPPNKHHARLLATMDTTRKMMAGVIFAASAQRGLGRDMLLRLLQDQTTSPTQGPTGALDEVSLALQMALLYALDLSVLHRREDGEELAKKLPLIQDPELISVLVDELSPPGNPPEVPEKGSGVRALCQLSLGLALAALKRAPQSLVRGASADLLDQDEMLVDAAIDGRVFEYLEEAILSTDFVSKEEYYQRRIHSLITDFIVLMHSKLMEMRVKADEAARAATTYAQEGLTAWGAGARPHLHALLACVRRLYARDPLHLRREYWAACNTGGGGGGVRAEPRAATLYKFVRLAGGLACASLLPLYLRALASLAVCRHTWALLARRDALSAHHLLTALHRYYHNLRADPSPFSEQLQASSLGASAILTPAARPGKLLVRQEEVEAMIAALQLIAAVAREDQAACVSICENLQWDAINVMFGLMCCHVPIQLKAALCSTVAALGAGGGGGGGALRVWAALEQAKLVTAPRALAADLREVECRMEEYPLSCALVSLLEALSGAGPPPRALGAGTRTPGLEPYVEYVLTNLALPAPHRPYAKPHHKWEMLSLCFRLFVRWLEQYEPSPADFPPLGREPDASPPPGFRLLVQLHTKSELLRLLFTSLDEAQDLLDQQPGLGREFVEQSLVSILQLLERALMLERALNSAAVEAGRGVLVIGLSKLILEPEGPENNCRLVTCCRAVSHGAEVRGAAARAVAVVRLAAHAPAAARDLLALLTHRHARAVQVRHGFVECLEAEEFGESDSEEAVALRQAKEGIVMLLHDLLPTAPPNLAHFLLGYQLTEDVSRSALNEPGAGGAPRTCLHSVLDILDQHIAGQNAANREATNLVESCYRLVYWLCARPSTSGPMLRFLRSRDYFLCRHLKHIVDLKSASAVTISSRSWVLRAAACAAGAAGAARHDAALTALLHTVAQPAARNAQDWEWCLLRRMMEELPLSVREAAEPCWELFQPHQLRQAIASCDLPTGLGGKRISVSRVLALLTRELAALNATAPQRNLVSLEIQNVLDYITEVNHQRNLAATLTHYYDSWRQLTEILFCVLPHDILDVESRKNLLLNILQDLLNKIQPNDVLPQIGNLASGTVLLLLVNLRHCYILQKRESNLKTSDFEMSFFGPSNQIMQTNSLTLKFILKKVLSWILVSGGSTQKMRVNLYSALLNYLNIVNLKQSPADPEEDVDSTYVSRLDSSKVKPSSEESSLKAMAVDVISDFGENLCTIVCSDCIGASHDVCRMVALSCLDMLIEINPRTDWMNTLTNQGYLRSLIDSLLQDDEGLKEALEPQPKSLRVLYVYESKMALLIKMSASRAGAETVLSQGALSCLANLTVLDCHPDIHTGYTTHRDTDFVPSVANRFRQILVPALSLCDALLTTLGAQNHSCVIHVTHMLLSHVECVDMVLRAAHPESSREVLREVEAVTSVVGRACGRGGAGAGGAGGEAPLRRLQALMLALLGRCARHTQPNHDDDTALLYYKIICNLLTYARNLISTPGERDVLRPLVEGAVGGAAPELQCGALVPLLRYLLHCAAHHRKLLATTRHQLHAVPTMTLDELRKTVGDAAGLSAVEVRLRAWRGAVQRVRARRKQLACVAHALQHALLLVWARARHALQAYTAPRDSAVLSPEEAWRGAPGEDLQLLRKELIGLFNDRFTEQLFETAEGQPAAQRNYLEVLVKDIKTMVQFAP